MKKLKVIQFTWGMLDGGTEKVLSEYVLKLDKYQFDVVVLNMVSAQGTASWKLMQDNHVRITTVYPWWVLKKWNLFGRAFNKFFGKWYTFKRLREIVAQEKPDIIHIHGYYLKLFSVISDSLKNVKLFYTCHSLPECYLGESEPQEHAAAVNLLKKNNLRMIALHDDMANEINEMFGIKNTVVINNAIDFKRFRNIEVSKDFERNKLGIPQNAFVLGHVGRFYDIQKNQSFLVDVFSEVVKQKPEAYLLMVGHGPDISRIVVKLDALGLQGKYKILLHRSDVNEILRAMDVFVFPSKIEGLGIVAIEAQVSGLRCVMSDQVPKSASLTDTAVALPLGDAKQWADVILNPDIKGKAYGNIEDWDMNKEIKKLEALYRGEL